MRSYGKVRSTVKPKLIDVKETKVFIASNITTVTVDDIMNGDSHEEYEYDLVEYDTAEYIARMNANIDFIAMMSDIPLEVLDA